jgi:hypothetical protein
MYAVLPNGRRLIVAALSNGYVQDEPEPWDIVRLNHYTELLIARLGVNQDLPQSRVLVPVATADGAYRVDLAAPEDGRYELAAWFDSSPTAGSAAEYVTIHADGTLTVTLDQRVWGSRWIKLGDVRLVRGAGLVTISNPGPGRVTPGSLRVTRWAN